MRLKNNIFISLFTLAAFSPSLGFGALGDFSLKNRLMNQPLEEVSWTGTLRCDEEMHKPDHNPNHECGLEFVNSDTDQVWNVKGDSQLFFLHQKENGPVPVKIKALKSPRFLFGGSYVRIKAIEVIKHSEGSAPEHL